MIVTDAWQPQINGVVRTYEYLSQALIDCGHDVRVIGPSSFPLRLPMPGYAEIELSLFAARRLARMIDEFAPDSLHIGTEGPLGWAARRHARRNGIRFTTAYHSQFPDYAAKRAGRIFPALQNVVRRKTDDLIRYFHAPAAAVIATTQTLVDELRARRYDMPLHTMNRGVPLDLFAPGRSDILSSLPGPIALYTGRVAVEKNLEAFLGMEWPGSKVVVGDGPDLPLLKNRYPFVHFAGRKVGGDLADHYRAADIFVFPSRTDTFGIVLIEALACGLPVAAYNVTGPRDIITHDFLGALHDHDLSQAARTALDISKNRKQERHDHVRAHYTWDAAARRFIEILDEAGA